MVKYIQQFMHMVLHGYNKTSVICTSSKLESELIEDLLTKQRAWETLERTQCGNRIDMSDQLGNTIMIVHNVCGDDLRGHNIYAMISTYKLSDDVVLPFLHASRGTYLYFDGNGKLLDMRNSC